MSAANAYLMVLSQGNYEVLRGEGLFRYGFKHFNRVKDRPKSRDKLVFYLKGGPSSIVAIATIVGRITEADPDDLLWPESDGPFLPHRVMLKPDIVLAPSDGILIRDLAPQLDIARLGTWPRWTMMLHTQNLQLHPDDFKVMHDALKSKQREIAKTRLL